jgi:hypothetical protein
VSARLKAHGWNLGSEPPRMETERPVPDEHLRLRQHASGDILHQGNANANVT